MVLFIIYPAVAALALFIVLIIMVILKYGPQLFKARHHTLSNHEKEFDDGAYYEQTISYA
jgi:hypothetical protein